MQPVPVVPLTIGAVLTVLAAPLLYSGWSAAGVGVTGQGVGLFVLSALRGVAMLWAAWAMGERVWGVAAVVVVTVSSFLLSALALDRDVERTVAAVAGMLALVVPGLLLGAGYLGGAKGLGAGSMALGLMVVAGLVMGHERLVREKVEAPVTEPAGLRESTTVEQLSAYTGFGESDRVREAALEKMRGIPGYQAELVRLPATPGSLEALSRSMEGMSEELRGQCWELAGKEAERMAKRMEAGGQPPGVAELHHLAAALAATAAEGEGKHRKEAAAVRAVLGKAREMGQFGEKTLQLDLYLGTGN